MNSEWRAWLAGKAQEPIKEGDDVLLDAFTGRVFLKETIDREQKPSDEDFAKIPDAWRVDKN